jgi:hypothetical protein
MNFSEYTLASFGDSFTFGDETVPDYPRGEWDMEESQQQWKTGCNLNSYTQVIADRFKFKDSINFGVLGGSNDRSLSLLEPYLHNHKEKKIFVMFNFTHPARFMNFFKHAKNEEYKPIDISPGYVDGSGIEERQYAGLTAKSIANQYTFWKNSIQDVYDHVRTRRMLYYILSTHNTPHVTFDILNTMDSRILRDNPLQWMTTDKDIDGSLIPHSDEIVRKVDFLQTYYDELKDDVHRLSHIGIKYHNNQNFHKYIGNLGKKDHANRFYYTSGNVGEGGHWTTEGHVKVANVIEKFINERYN